MVTPDERVALTHEAKRFFEGMLPENEGFMLLLFPQGERGICSYMSNSQREDIIGLMFDTLIQWKAPVVNDIMKMYAQQCWLVDFLDGLLNSGQKKDAQEFFSRVREDAAKITKAFSDKMKSTTSKTMSELIDEFKEAYRGTDNKQG